MWKLFAFVLVLPALVACVPGDGESSNGTGTTSSSVIGDFSEDNFNEGPAVPADIDGQFFYFSYDDSSSTAARDLSIFALDNGSVPASYWGRPYEFLNAEVLDHFNEEQLGPFGVSIGAYVSEPGDIVLTEEQGQLFALGVNLTGPVISKEERKNVVLTLLLDISGSMQGSYAYETRSDLRSLLDVAKHGLQQLPLSLKEGDVVNLVTFGSYANVLSEGRTFDQDGWSQLITGINSDGSTDLNAGIKLAYEVANRTYNPEKANRVILLTDAYANQGEIDPAVISERTVINGLEGIYFAGVGIGSGFNEAFLNELTEAGKGVYSAMITPTDAERIFTNQFMRFIDTAVKDVKFKLEYPNSLKHVVSAAEEVSETESDVQSVDFSYNSQQFFYEVFLPAEDYSNAAEITLEIQYRDASNELVYKRLTKTLADLVVQGEEQIKSAAAVTTLAYLISGRASCDDVLASGLYADEVDQPLFMAYKTHIAYYCSL
ncbi:MAG: VWA domain-containing protein [Thalassolituus sp.]|uniref:vWA domain-containing protein n=1 Tax=Thalassolituus sp. TaxID=2030822 RepID=UPI003982A7FF